MKLIMFCTHMLTAVTAIIPGISIPGLDECSKSGMKLTNIDPSNLNDLCSAAKLAMFEDVVAKCTGTDPGSQAFAASAKQYKQLCSGGTECMPLGVKLATVDPSNLSDMCSAANLAMFEDVVAKCAGTDAGSQAFAASAQQYKQLCSGGTECMPLGAKLATVDPSNLSDMCSAANLAMFEDVVAKCAGTDAGSQAFAASAKQYKQLCSGGGIEGGIENAIGNAMCDQVPEGKKQQCKDAMAECMAKTGDDAQKACVEGKVKEIMKEAMPSPEDFCAQAPEVRKKKCNDAIAECMGKATEDEQKACWEGKVKEIGEEGEEEGEEEGAVSIAASTTITFAFGLVSMMAF